MVAPLDLCTVETVEIAIGGGRRVKIMRVTAHRYLDFAIHREETRDLFRERWCITHAPSGRRVADGFAIIDIAAAAMIEIARLRNDWAVADDEAAGKESARKVEEIIKRHDARARLGSGRRGNTIHNVLNGYAEQSSA